MLKCWLSKVRRGAVLHRENQINEVSALSEEIGISSEGNRVRGRKQKHHQTMIDMKMTKITPGFVSQVYNTEADRFTSQEFVAGHDVRWEDDEGERADAIDAYLPFEMVQPPAVLTREEIARESMIRKLVAKDGDVEFSRDALISEGEENGAYVQCWQWVSFAGHPALDKESATERKHRS